MRSDYALRFCDEALGHRYRLDVLTRASNGPHLAVVQLNPSTADMLKADPTVGKVATWACEHGFSGVTFLNLFAFRSANPKLLAGHDYATLTGPRNDSVTKAALAEAQTIIFAWGKVLPVLESHYLRRISVLSALLQGREVHAIGSAVGKRFPRHGLMWNGENRTLRKFTWEQFHPATLWPVASGV